MAHLTVALSENAVRSTVDVLVQSIAWEAQDSKDFGAFSAGYHVKGHLEGGAVDLRADNTIEVCDGLPSFVEEEIVTSPDYCPWSAVAIKLEGPGAG